MFGDIIEIERAKREVDEAGNNLPNIADAPSIVCEAEPSGVSLVTGWLAQLKDKFVPRERLHDEVC